VGGGVSSTASTCVGNRLVAGFVVVGERKGEELVLREVVRFGVVPFAEWREFMEALRSRLGVVDRVSEEMLFVVRPRVGARGLGETEDRRRSPAALECAFDPHGEEVRALSVGEDDRESLLSEPKSSWSLLSVFTAGGIS
jgi:hypothetical protein